MFLWSITLEAGTFRGIGEKGYDIYAHLLGVEGIMCPKAKRNAEPGMYECVFVELMGSHTCFSQKLSKGVILLLRGEKEAEGSILASKGTNLA